MLKIREYLNRLRRKPPVIDTPYGTVTESARLQAALNMKADHELRMKVVRLIAKQHSMTLGEAWAETRRRYPEAGWND